MHVNKYFVKKMSTQANNQKNRYFYQIKLVYFILTQTKAIFSLKNNL